MRRGIRLKETGQINSSIVTDPSHGDVQQPVGWKDVQFPLQPPVSPLSHTNNPATGPECPKDSKSTIPPWQCYQRYKNSVAWRH